MFYLGSIFSLLQVFGALCWLVVEPNERVFNSILLNSQLRAAYENTTVGIQPGLLKARFEAVGSEIAEETKESEGSGAKAEPWDDSTICLQPMVITPPDLNRLKTELEEEGNQKQTVQEAAEIGSKRQRMKQWLHRLLYGKYSADEFFKGGKKKDLGSAEFAAGENPGGEIHQPLWMTFNSNGLQFCPAVTFGYSNWTSVRPVVIPANQVSALTIKTLL